MIEIIKLKNMDNIGGILDFIHDLWFDLEEVTLDLEAQSLKFPLYEKVGWRGHKIFGRDKSKFKEKYTLLINNVLNVDILDSEKVGSYDVNNIEYERDRKEMTINTGIPLKFKIKVDEPEIFLLEKAGI